MGIHTSNRRWGVIAAVAAVLAGWILLLPLGTQNPLARWSYDLPQLFQPGHHLTNIIVVHMDEQAVQDYRQQPGKYWSRAIHARLLNRLTQDQPKVVVFDVEMPEASNRDDDEKLVRAIRDNGRVVLAGGKSPLAGVAVGFTINPPYELFETNAAGWGIAKVLLAGDRVGRQFEEGPGDEASLAWVAASVSGAPATRSPDRRRSEIRWLNYYGMGRPFAASAMSYTNAEAAAPGFFRDKAVFIGGHPDTQMRGDTADVFGTPFTKWNEEFAPGVELIAVAYANLISEQWLRRTGLLTEVALLALAGFVAAWAAGFGAGSPARALLGAAGLFVALSIAAVVTTVATRCWFPWVNMVIVEIPCALLIVLFGRTLENAKAVRLAQLAPETQLDGRPQIPDQTLVRCIGEGAYGQVWLARNTLGLHHALKVIYRSRFGTEVPYERALRGIQKFMPISRSHQGFVHLLHVGRNDRAGFFFYLMEAGDDVKSAQRIDPNTYAPKTLSNELKSRGPLPPKECLELLLALTDAVERLHQHQLVHRDIKPDNIIFVQGRPKLADIDLVTSLAGPGEVSHIGTEGYMAPEGPGTAAADVFSLGRVLYVMLTGKAPAQCPELPTQVTSQPDSGLYFEINRVVCKACEFSVERRYPSASAMGSDLRAIAERLARD